MKTAIVKLSVDALLKRLAAFRLGELAREAKHHPCAGMPGCTAIQHPRIARMSDQELYDVCNLARIPLVQIIEARPLP